MNTEMKEMSFPLAMRDFFGKNGQDLTTFQKELKALDEKDKTFFKAELGKIGYNIK